MADVREIRSHMKGVRDTAKITNAMYMIASSKMRRAKQELDRTRPYFDSVQKEIKRIFRVQPPENSPYFFAKGGIEDIPGAYGYLVITSDKGLAGFYNHAILKEMTELLTGHESRVYMIGEVGKKYCQVQGIEYEEDFDFSSENPTLRQARLMALRLLNDYLSGKITKIYIIYTDLKSNVYQQAIKFRLLPFHQMDFVVDTMEHETVPKSAFEFLPSIEEVLDNMVLSYMSGYIYSALVDSFCCEQSSRMNAMEEANKNADEILSELNLQYNHARQGRITQEITEISSGARALKRKKKRG